MSGPLRGMVFALLVSAAPVSAVETRQWTASPDELLRGSAEGVAVSARGRLYLAPRTQRLAGALGRTATVETWSACRGGPGEMFFGTGPDGLVYRTDGNGRGAVFFDTGEAMVTALHRHSGGDLLAATSPGGRIYRIDGAGNGRLWAETEERYVWALAESDGGNVYVATGDRGRVLRVGNDGSIERHFDSGESHIVALVHDGGGRLLAGGSGMGRVYSIDPEGFGLVLYDDDLPEARALVRDGAGGWTVALVGDPPAETRRPALRLRLPDGTPVGAIEPTVAIDERSGPVLQGFIEGLAGEPRPGSAVRGRLVRLDADGSATTLWESPTETPLSLETDAAGRVVMGTGQPARLYRVEDGDDVALIATLKEAHTTVLVRDERTLFAATSHPASVWRVEAVDAEQGSYLSPAFDAGGPARWGSISWAPAGRLARTEVYTRTGNSARPDATWSAWSPAQVLAGGSPVDNPDGRFAQFRVRFIGAQERDARLGDVTLLYETYNRPPALLDERGRALAAVRETAEFPWIASDPDGDTLEVVLEYRAAFATRWTTAAGSGTISPAGTDAAAPRSGTLTWDTAELAEGLYDVRLVADDGPANDPAEGRRAYGRLRRIAIDRTVPAVDVRRLADGRYEAVVADEASRVTRLKLLRDGRQAASIRAADGVCDSRRERFEFAVPAGTARWTVRGSDLAGNETVAELPPP